MFFEKAGRWVDGRFIAFRDWLDRKLVPQWRIWWKLRSMQLGVFFAALMTYVAEVPSTIQQVLNSLPPWMQNSMPTWIGPVILFTLFIARFWDQAHDAADKAAQAKVTGHGAE